MALKVQLRCRNKRSVACFNHRCTVLGFVRPAESLLRKDLLKRILLLSFFSWVSHTVMTKLSHFRQSISSHIIKNVHWAACKAKTFEANLDSFLRVRVIKGVKALSNN